MSAISRSSSFAFPPSDDRERLEWHIACRANELAARRGNDPLDVFKYWRQAEREVRQAFRPGIKRQGAKTRRVGSPLPSSGR